MLGMPITLEKKSKLGLGYHSYIITGNFAEIKNKKKKESRKEKKIRHEYSTRSNTYAGNTRATGRLIQLDDRRLRAATNIGTSRGCRPRFNLGSLLWQRGSARARVLVLSLCRDILGFGSF